MAQQLLHGTDVRAVLDEVRGEGVAERVGTGRLLQFRPAHGTLNCFLDGRSRAVVTARRFGTRILR